MKTESESFRLLVDELKNKFQDEESQALLSEAEGLFTKLESSFLGRAKLDRDEIAVLRKIAGILPGESKFLLAGQEIENSNLRMELEERLLELKSLKEKCSYITQENRKLEDMFLSMSGRYAKSKDSLARSISELDGKKSAIADTVEKMEEKITALTAELGEVARRIEIQFRQEQEAFEKMLIKQMSESLDKQRNRLLAHEETQVSGLYYFFQQRVETLSFAVQRLMDKFPAVLAPSSEERKTWIDRFLWLSPKYRKLEKFRVDVEPDLSSLRQTLMTNAESLYGLHEQIKSFAPMAKIPPMNPKKLLLPEVAEEVLLLNDEFLKSNNINATETFRDSAPVVADREMVKSAFTEILMNAVEAQPRGGDIDVSYEENADASWAGIMVKDAGAGVTKNALEKIFQPYYTTKERHPGLGLSRALLYALLNGGDMEVHTESVGGAFLLKFPLHKEK